MPEPSGSPMRTTRPEPCETCQQDTQHNIHIEMRDETTPGKQAGYGREPYRITKCRRCGVETATRWNNV